MNFKKKRILRIISGILLIFLGWLALGIGYTLKSDLNGLIFYSGFVLIIIGIVILSIKIKRPIHKLK